MGAKQPGGKLWLMACRDVTIPTCKKSVFHVEHWESDWQRFDMFHVEHRQLWSNLSRLNGERENPLFRVGKWFTFQPSEVRTNGLLDGRELNPTTSKQRQEASRLY